MNSLKVSDIKSRTYDGGELVVERQLEDGDGYTKWVVSYPSDGLKIYGLLMLPKGESGGEGWPLVVFNRGYVDPVEYQIDRQYTRYMGYFAKAGFAVFKSDYRGIGESEGEIDSVVSSANATDVLNGIASLRQFRHSRSSRESMDPQLRGDDINIDWNKVVIWGHSMGGFITLQCLLANQIFKAAAIWAGFMIPFADIIERWQNSPLERQHQRAADVLKTYGHDFSDPIWHEISPFYYLSDMPCKIQLHHGLKDEIIPVTDSQRIYDELLRVDRSGGLDIYNTEGHNLNGPEMPEVMQNTIGFFKQEIK